MYPAFRLKLPDWIADVVGDPDRRYPTLEDRMALAVRLSERNIEEGGGPFGAAVFEIATGRLVAPGVNLVVPLHSSVAHAEAVAIITAQTVCGTHDLSAPGMAEMELVSSSQPCIQCFGNLWWSGLRRLVIGATKEDVETLAGFNEGPVPERWADYLADRAPLPSVTVVQGVLREEARKVLLRYRELGGSIYNPG